ncbi:hypothetical protein HAX54_047464 [Datura stramonium]|uniref:PORR domain-containing protein n=1 Tax=Datura stramonium TaxID=4076 RepID=A0ABS8SSG1_DATST|nr:hypothetical protein [Datura stramonium]
MWVQIRFKSSGGRRPKKKTYYRVNDLDRVMELQKKPSLILRLKSIIQSQKSQCLLLRDLEKEVGFVHKWNFMGIIEKYPSIFRVTGGNRTPPMVMLTEKANKVALEEDEARVQMEPILVKNLRKLLMLSVDCMLPLETIQLIENDLGLPSDFRQSLIPKYPQFFSVKDVNGRTSLQLENWDSFLAVTAREERLVREGVLTSKEQARVLKDGYYSGPFAFQMRYPAGFRPNMNYLKEVQKWQKMEFPSPYLNARRFELADPKAQKRVVAVLHELLSLTVEKRLTSAQIDAFHSELRLPARLLLCLIKHHVIPMIKILAPVYLADLGYSFCIHFYVEKGLNNESIIKIGKTEEMYRRQKGRELGVSTLEHEKVKKKDIEAGRKKDDVNLNV